MRRITPVLAASGLAAAVALAGCSAADPKPTVDQAIKALSERQASTTTIRLDTTPADLDTVSKALEENANPTRMAQLNAAFKVIPMVSITSATRAHEGTLQQATSLDKVDFATTVAVGDKSLEILKVNDKGFLRVDVDGIGQQTGLFSGAQVRMMAAGLGASKPWVSDLIDGKWMQVDGVTMNELAAKATQQAQAPQTIDPAKYLNVVTANSTVTKVNDTTYTVTTDAKGLIKGLADIDPNDKFTTEDADKAIADLQDGANLDTTLTIESGKLTKASIDLADVLRTWVKPSEGSGGDTLRRLQAAQFKLNLVAEISDQADIAEPASATTIPDKDVQDLLKGLNSLPGNR
ncbi:MAG: hypothetical protein QM695_10955 [Micropruina sp.]